MACVLTVLPEHVRCTTACLLAKFAAPRQLWINAEISVQTYTSIKCLQHQFAHFLPRLLFFCKDYDLHLCRSILHAAIVSVPCYCIITGIRKKLAAASRRAGCAIIKEWTQSIVNHLYWWVCVPAEAMEWTHRRAIFFNCVAIAVSHIWWSKRMSHAFILKFMIQPQRIALPRFTVLTVMAFWTLCACFLEMMKQVSEMVYWTFSETIWVGHITSLN